MRAFAATTLWFSIVTLTFWGYQEAREGYDPPEPARPTVSATELERNCAREIEALADRPARQAEVRAICTERLEALLSEEASRS